MAVYAYKATDLDASVVSGTLVADTPRQARDDLRDRGLSVHEIAEHRAQAGSQGRFPLKDKLFGETFFRGGVSQTKAVGFIRELSTLLGVGMPLLEALDTITAQQSGRFRAVLMLLRDRVSSGSSLAEAMREQPRVFDPVTVNMTEVGENAGTLEEVLAELASFKEKSAQMRGKIVSALLYPAIVLTTGIGVALFLMTYVVPGLLEALIEAGKPLPWVTQLVKGLSDFLITRWWSLIGVVVAAVVLGEALYRTSRGRYFGHRLILRLPVLGDLIRKQAVVRIAFVVSTLMRSGIPFERAVEIVQRSTSNVILRDALVAVEEAVHAGRDIGEALHETEAFPPTVVQVFSLGQESGRLEEMLERLAVDYDRQVATAAGRLTAVLEPVLILLLAAVVGFIAFATILPILEVGNVL